MSRAVERMAEIHNLKNCLKEIHLPYLKYKDTWMETYRCDSCGTEEHLKYQELPCHEHGIEHKWLMMTQARLCTRVLCFFFEVFDK